MKKSVKRFLSVSLVIILFFSYIPFGGIAALSELMSVKSHAADSNDAGSVVTFGSYPQTLVTDKAITDVLTEKVFDGDIEFKAYDYKCGNGEDFDARGEEYMGYADAVYNGEKYRGVYFDLYRPVYSFFPATDDEDSSFQAENGYERYQFYWFKYEPLKWRVLDAESGLLLCESVIDSQPFSDYMYMGDDDECVYKDASRTGYANLWSTSTVRDFLNDDFYNTSFTETEQSRIVSTRLENNSLMTLLDMSGYSEFDDVETEDNVFLLSYDDIINEDYGFDCSCSAIDSLRIAYGTDYAKAQGLALDDSEGAPIWRLRTPFLIGATTVNVYFNGTVPLSEADSLVTLDIIGSTFLGIRPALRVGNLDSLLSKSEYTVSYDANGGTKAPLPQVKKYNQDINISGNKPEKSGYNFIEWNTEADGSGFAYPAGAVFGLNKDTVLYAQWTDKCVPVLDTYEAFSISQNSAKLAADVIFDGGYAIKTRYFTYYERLNPDNKFTVVASSTFSATLTGLKPGTDYVCQAAAENEVGVGYSDLISFTTVKAAENNPVSIKVNESQVVMTVGKTRTLFSTVLPQDASNRSVTWSSNNPSVAKVSNGVVTALKTGEAVITALTQNGLTSSCTVVVQSEIETLDLDFSEHNLVGNMSNLAPDGYDYTPDEGGTNRMAAAYFSRWDGPVLEKDDPYPVSGKSRDIKHKEVDAAAHIQNVLILNKRSSSLDNDDLKYAIMNYGGVSVGMLWSHGSGCLSSDQKSFYRPKNYVNYSGAEENGHAVLLVGWDDNYSRNNFAIKPSGDGAFICKNSWGTGFGDNGYFYVSYYDPTFAIFNSSAVFYGLESKDNYNKVYQYDDLGYVQDYPVISNSGWLANVFTVDGSKDENLEAVSFYILNGGGTQYKVYVIPNFTGTTPDISKAKLFAEGNKDYAGYYTVNRDEKCENIKLRAGSKFAVLVKYSCPSAYPKLAVEYPGNYASKAHAEKGQSFKSNGSSGNSWTDISRSGYNACIKAFTDGTTSLAKSSYDDEPLRKTDRFSEILSNSSNGLISSLSKNAEVALARGESEGEYPLMSSFARDTLGAKSASTTDGASFPSKYDLRDEGAVSSVKNQGSIGSCWAFAACGSIESCQLKKGKSIQETETYTVSYDANGGTGAPASQPKTKNVDLTLSGTKPSRTVTITWNANGGSVASSSKNLGYTFKNWNTVASGSGTAYNPGGKYSANANAVLYAQWTAPKYGTMPTPTRSGYVFEGWYTSASGGQRVLDTDTVTSSRTLYAHWNTTAVKDHFIKSDEDNIELSVDGTYVVMVSCTADTALSVRASYLTSELHAEFGDGRIEDGIYYCPLTISGVAECNNSTVNLSLYNKSTGEEFATNKITVQVTAAPSVQLGVGKSVNITTTRPYYSVDLWYYCENAGNVVDLDFGDGWVGNELNWTITGKNKGTTQIKLKYVDSDTDETLGTEVIHVTVGDAETYTVSYNANGGTGAPSAQTKTKNVDLTLSSTRPSKSVTVTWNANGGTVSPSSKNLGCTFSGWNTSSSGTGTTYQPGGKYSANASTVLYAQWSPATMGTMPVPTRSGYTFDGWYTQASGGSRVYESSTFSSSQTLYAHWTSQPTYDYFVEAAYDNITVTVDGSYTVTVRVTSDEALTVSASCTDDNVAVEFGEGEIVDDVCCFPLTIYGLEKSSKSVIKLELYDDITGEVFAENIINVVVEDALSIEINKGEHFELTSHRNYNYQELYCICEDEGTIVDFDFSDGWNGNDCKWRIIGNSAGTTAVEIFLVDEESGMIIRAETIYVTVNEQSFFELIFELIGDFFRLIFSPLTLLFEAIFG